MELSSGEPARKNHCHAALLHDHAIAERAAGGIHFDAADGAEEPRQYDRLAGRALRRLELWQGDRVCLLEGEAHLWSRPNRSPYRSRYDDFAAALPLEPDGLASHPGQSTGHSDR